MGLFDIGKKKERRIDAINVIVKEIKDIISESSGIALINKKGLTVQQDTDLRAFFRNINVTYKIIKGADFKEAIEDTDFENLQEYAEGGYGTVFFNELEQLGLLLQYCEKSETNLSVEAAGYQKKLLLSDDLDKILKDQIQHIEEKNADKSAIIAEEPESAEEINAKSDIDSDANVFSVILKESGPNIVDVIQFVRKHKNINMLTAKNLVQSAPCTLETEVSKEQADILANALQNLGAVTEIVPVKV